MNREKEFLKLLQLFSDYNLRFHISFVDELMALFNHFISERARLFKILTKQLNILCQVREKIITVDNHERLSYVNDFACYSIHISAGQFNIRLLMTFIKEDIVFLVAFNEVAGKKATDYTYPIQQAIERYKEYIR